MAVVVDMVTMLECKDSEVSEVKECGVSEVIEIDEDEHKMLILKGVLDELVSCYRHLDYLQYTHCQVSDVMTMLKGRYGVLDSLRNTMDKITSVIDS